MSRVCLLARDEEAIIEFLALDPGGISLESHCTSRSPEMHMACLSPRSAFFSTTPPPPWFLVATHPRHWDPMPDDPTSDARFFCGPTFLFAFFFVQSLF